MPTHLLNASALVSLFQQLAPLFEEILPDIQSKPSIAELETVFSCPITRHVKKRATSSSLQLPYRDF